MKGKTLSKLIINVEIERKGEKTKKIGKASIIKAKHLFRTKQLEKKLSGLPEK